MNKLVVRFAVVAALVAASLALTIQRGGEGCFSPYSLEYRVRSERTVLEFPIYHSNWEYVDNEVLTMLVEENFVTPQAGDLERWETIFHWNEAWHDGFGLLYDIFRRNKHEIIEWSRNHRDCAKLYWAEGFRLLRSANRLDNLTGYEILRRCWGAKDVDELQTKMQHCKAEIGSLFKVES
jgi:hypothetical protein